MIESKRLRLAEYASNEIFTLSTKLIIIITSITPLLIWLIKSTSTNNQTPETINFYIINNSTNIALIKLYNFQTNIITIILTLYL